MYSKRARLKLVKHIAKYKSFMLDTNLSCLILAFLHFLSNLPETLCREALDIDLLVLMSIIYFHAKYLSH